MANFGPQKWAEDTKAWILGPKDQAGTEFIQLLYDFSPLAHKYIDYLYDKRNTEQYLNRYGIEYEDIYDFRKLPSTGSSAGSLLAAELQYVSKNVNKLYR